MKKINIEINYNNKISNKEELLNQLDSLRKEAYLMYTNDEIFRKDWHALVIAEQIIKQLDI